MLVLLFISVFEFTYFCFKLVFEYLPHSFLSQIFIYNNTSFGLYKFLASLSGIGAVHFLSLEVDILKSG